MSLTEGSHEAARGEERGEIPASTTRLLHITYAKQDRQWVEGTLIAALSLTKDQYRTRQHDVLGVPKVEEIEQAVRESRYTLLVASDAAAVNSWVEFAASLAQHLGVEEDRRRLLVVALHSPALLPLRQRALVCMDCSTAEKTPRALAALAAQLALAPQPRPTLECPYPGLRTFGEGDAESFFNHPELFFGRDNETTKIIERVRADGRMLLNGPSGCGKSSLMRARVLPELGRGSRAMTVALTRPGARPLAALHTALLALEPRLSSALDAFLRAETSSTRRALAVPGMSSMLLCIDQLEEIFLDEIDAGERAKFFAGLKALHRVGRISLLLSIRADFHGNMMSCPLWEEFHEHHLDLAPLRGEALKAAITQPAKVVGVHVEVDLAERLVREADLDRGAEALPLLQVALVKLWSKRQWRYLSLESYQLLIAGDDARRPPQDQRAEAPRGLDLVFGRHADEALGKLSEEQRRLARRIFVELVHLGEGRPNTRRRRSEAELLQAGETRPQAAAVIDHLLASRLITTASEERPGKRRQRGGGSPNKVALVPIRVFDLAHDSLITGWPTLRNWLRDKDALGIMRRLDERVASGGLLSADELSEMRTWLSRPETQPGGAMAASQEMRDLVHRTERNHARAQATKRIAIALIALAAVIAILQWRRAQTAAELANQESTRRQQLLSTAMRETGRQLVQEGRLQSALPYLVASLYGVTRPSTSTRVLLGSATRVEPLFSFPHRGMVTGASFSADGRRIVTAPTSSTVQIWSADTGAPLGMPIEHGVDEHMLMSITLSADGLKLVTTCTDGTARVWDARTGATISAFMQHTRPVRSATFSGDGSLVATASLDFTARIWDSATGLPASGPLIHHEEVTTVAFDAAGRRLLTTSIDGSARLWEVPSGRLLAQRSFSTPFLRAKLSPREDYILILGAAERSGFWDAQLEHQLSKLEAPDQLSKASFGGREDRLAFLVGERSVALWNASSRTAIKLLQHQDSIFDLATSPDGRTLLTSSRDGVATPWSFANGESLGYVFEHGAPIFNSTFNAKGDLVLTTADDNLARVWRIPSSTYLKRTIPQNSRAISVQMSPSGSLLLTLGSNREVQLWDFAAGQRIGKPLGHASWVTCFLISPDESQIATCTEAGRVQIWEASSGAPLRELVGHEGGRVVTAQYSQDGSRLLTASRDGTARVWNTATGEQDGAILPHPEEPSTALFLDSDREVAIVSRGRAHFWNARTKQSTGHLLFQDDNSRIFDASVSPDGAVIATSSYAAGNGEENAVLLWDAKSRTKRAPELMHPTEVTSITFSPDGTRLATSCHDYSARIWDVATGRLVTAPMKHEEQIASMSFSPDGELLVTASQDKTARVWDVGTGLPLAPSFVHDAPVSKAVFTADGSSIVTASSDGAVRVWEVAPKMRSGAELRKLVERGPFELADGVLVHRRAR